MDYFVSLKYGFCLRVHDVAEMQELSVIFPNKSDLFSSENSGETFTKFLKSVKCRHHIQGLHIFEITDKHKNIVFAYLGTLKECETIKKFFNTGIIVETNIDTKSINMGVDNSIAQPNTTLKRMKLYPDFISHFILSKDVDILSQPICVPKSYLVKVVSDNSSENTETTRDKISKVNKDTTYENEEIFQNVMKAVQDIKNGYSDLVSQKEGLHLVVKTCDYEIMNILHELELEFDKVNACQGYKLSQKISEIRKCRRRAKDKLAVIDTIEHLLPLTALTEIENIPNKLANRTYSRRNNYGMFDYEKIEDNEVFVEMTEGLMD